MTWETITRREPELRHAERSCKAARQQSASWFDFLFEHDGQITKLAAQLPTTELRCQAMAAIESHLVSVWTSTMDSPPGLPWASRPSFEVSEGAKP